MRKTARLPLHFMPGQGFPGTSVFQQLDQKPDLMPGVMPNEFWFYPLQGSAFYVGVRKADGKKLEKAKGQEEKQRLLMSLAFQEVQAKRMNRRSPGTLIVVTKTKDGFRYAPASTGFGAPPKKTTTKKVANFLRSRPAQYTKDFVGGMDPFGTLTSGYGQKAEQAGLSGKEHALRAGITTAGGVAGGALLVPSGISGVSSGATALMTTPGGVGKRLAAGGRAFAQGAKAPIGGLVEGFRARRALVRASKGATSFTPKEQLALGNLGKQVTVGDLGRALPTNPQRDTIDYLSQTAQAIGEGKAPAAILFSGLAQKALPQVDKALGGGIAGLGLGGAVGGFGGLAQYQKGRSAEKGFQQRLSQASSTKAASIEYRGHTFPGYNQPIASSKKDKKKMVLVRKGDQVRVVHYGQKGYQHNYSEGAKKNYLSRSAGIRNKAGELTMNDPFSPNYWARKDLWPSGEANTKSSTEKTAKVFGQVRPSDEYLSLNFSEDSKTRAYKAYLRAKAREGPTGIGLAGLGGAAVGTLAGAGAGALIRRPGDLRPLGVGMLAGAGLGALVGAAVGAKDKRTVNEARKLIKDPEKLENYVREQIDLAPSRAAAAKAMQDAAFLANGGIRITTTLTDSRRRHDDDFSPPRPVATNSNKYKCGYCGTVNPTNIGNCRGCGAPLGDAVKVASLRDFFASHSKKADAPKYSLTPGERAVALTGVGLSSLGLAANVHNLVQDIRAHKNPKLVPKVFRPAITTGLPAAGMLLSGGAAIRAASRHRTELKSSQNKHASANQEVVESPHSFHPVKVEKPKATRKKYPFQGYIDFQGIKIDVENIKGSTRSGKDKDGSEWSIKMHAHYGEIRGTEGADGDKLDVYVGPNHDSGIVVVIHQTEPSTGEYDEDKVMLGFDSVEEAIGAYKSQYNKPGFYREGNHLAMPIGRFWRWVHDRKNRGKKVASANAASSNGDKRSLGMSAADVGIGAIGVGAGKRLAKDVLQVAPKSETR